MIPAMQRMVLAAVLLATGLAVYAQPAPQKYFEVVSIKPSRANCTPPGGGPSPGRLDLGCVRVRDLIQAAYGMLAGGQLTAKPAPVQGGPAWLDSDRYAITAKAEGRASAAEMLGPMMQTLLEDRFQLKLHRETKQVDAYALTVAKGGPKLKPAREGGCVPLDLNNPDVWRDRGPAPCGFPTTRLKDGLMTVDFAGATMDDFANRAPYGAGRRVVDKTGLAGRYDIHLEFARELPSGSIRLNGMEPPAPAESAGPSVFAALSQQLGLKLAPDKAPIEVIVIDSVQRPTPD